MVEGSVMSNAEAPVPLKAMGGGTGTEASVGTGGGAAGAGAMAVGGAGGGTTASVDGVALPSIFSVAGGVVTGVAVGTLSVECPGMGIAMGTPPDGGAPVGILPEKSAGEAMVNPLAGVEGCSVPVGSGPSGGPLEAPLGGASLFPPCGWAIGTSVPFSAVAAAGSGWGSWEEEGL